MLGVPRKCLNTPLPIGLSLQPNSDQGLNYRKLFRVKLSSPIGTRLCILIAQQYYSEDNNAQWSHFNFLLLT